MSSKSQILMKLDHFNVKKGMLIITLNKKLIHKIPTSDIIDHRKHVAFKNNST
jgi:hypothetical protein